jgi:hypothetical protein
MFKVGEKSKPVSSGRGTDAEAQSSFKEAL